MLLCSDFQSPNHLTLNHSGRTTCSTCGGEVSVSASRRLSRRSRSILTVAFVSHHVPGTAKTKPLLHFSIAHQILHGKFYNCMEVRYLPVYFPSEEEKSNPKLFAHNVRQIMASALGVRTTEHAYEDVMLQGEVRFVSGLMVSGLSSQSLSNRQKGNTFPLRRCFSRLQVCTIRLISWTCPETSSLCISTR